MKFSHAIALFTLLALPAFSLAAEQQEISVATMPPVVVKTVPEAGSMTVDPATTEIRATFSKDMRDGSWSFVQASPEENYPATTDRPHYLDDHRTIVLPVKLEPGRTYLVWLNDSKFNNFRDSDGHRSVPYLLVFKTADK
jgi:hypothetical protein